MKISITGALAALVVAFAIVISPVHSQSPIVHPHNTEVILVMNLNNGCQVDATSSWQCDQSLDPGDYYVSASGSWSIDAEHDPWVGPSGYDSGFSSRVAHNWPDCRMMNGNGTIRFGMLVMQMDGQIYPIGSGRRIHVGSSTNVQFSIADGDSCLGDNGGSVWVTNHRS